MARIESRLDKQNYVLPTKIVDGSAFREFNRLRDMKIDIAVVWLSACQPTVDGAMCIKSFGSFLTFSGISAGTTS